MGDDKGLVILVLTRGFEFCLLEGALKPNTLHNPPPALMGLESGFSKDRKYEALCSWHTVCPHRLWIIVVLCLSFFVCLFLFF